MSMWLLDPPRQSSKFRKISRNIQTLGVTEKTLTSLMRPMTKKSPRMLSGLESKRNLRNWWTV